MDCLSREEVEAGCALVKADAFPIYRPRRRAECEPGGWNAQRPCPFVGCKHHLFLEVKATGNLNVRMELD